jgi:hypothetical protein
MGFFGGLFGKKRINDVIVETYSSIFNIHGITNPTDAQKMKASFYLCIAGMAMINDALGGQRAPAQIDNLLRQTKTLSNDLMFRICDISNNESDLGDLLSEFPPEIKADGQTRVNGLAGFEALYFTKGQSLMLEIMNKQGGPFGLAGYAAVIVVDGIFGKGRSIEKMMDNVLIISNYQKNILSCA